MERGTPSRKSIAERCPSCERAVGGLGWVCPYCGEGLRGRRGMWVRFHAPMGALVVGAVPYALWGGTMLSMVPFAVWAVAECCRRRSFRAVYPWLVGGVMIGLWSLVDRVVLWDGWILWNRYGANGGLILLAVYQGLQDPMEGGVDDVGIWEWGRIRLLSWLVDALLWFVAWGLMRG